MQQLTKQFGKIKVSLPIPHLLNLQVDSYSVFLQEGRKDALIPRWDWKACPIRLPHRGLQPHGKSRISGL